jgi:hypothetical protein
MTKEMMKNFIDLKSGYEVSQFLFVGVIDKLFCCSFN